MSWPRISPNPESGESGESSGVGPTGKLSTRVIRRLRTCWTTAQLPPARVSTTFALFFLLNLPRRPDELTPSTVLHSPRAPPYAPISWSEIHQSFLSRPPWQCPSVSASNVPSPAPPPAAAATPPSANQARAKTAMSTSPARRCRR